MVTRRAVLSGIALAVLVPGAAAASLSIDAVGYLQSRPSVVTVAAPRESAQLGDLAITLIDAGIAEAGTAAADDLAVPGGADLLVARFAVDPGDEMLDGLPHCEIAVVADGPDGPARWVGSGYVDADYRVADDVETVCARGTGSRYELEVLFLLPAGVENVEFEVTAYDLLPRAIRIPLH